MDHMSLLVWIWRFLYACDNMQLLLEQASYSSKTVRNILKKGSSAELSFPLRLIVGMVCSYCKGQQVFLGYGRLSNIDLLGMPYFSMGL